VSGAPGTRRPGSATARTRHHGSTGRTPAVARRRPPHHPQPRDQRAAGGA
jgi:hypothetical protein